MKRRQFIRLSTAASAAALSPFELQAALKSFMPFAGCPDISNRKLILINLAGANDGLNTIIPLNQYDTYSLLRPTIKVPDTGLHKYITLDSTLPDNQQVGLNPALTGFKSLYDEGVFRIMQSVGYPSQNKSHFKSKDLYMTGNDGNNMLNGVDTGWIGRFMELYYSDLIFETYPLAVEIGSNKTSLGFHGEEAHGLSLNITGQDPAGFYSVLNGLGGIPPQDIPNSDYGKQLEYIKNIDSLSSSQAQSISGAFNHGKNEASYPDTDLSNQLKTVAKLISGDLQSKVYMVRISGFDTHNSQVAGNGEVSGRHFNLLTELSEAIKAFMDDLKTQNLDKDVIGLTFSEFGRKAKENGSFGTDHGEIAPMFVFGKPVSGGVSGTNPDLTEAKDSNNYQIKTVQYDYRQTFTTLLQDFLGADNRIIDATFFNHTLNDSFTNMKVGDILKESFSVTTDCNPEAKEIPLGTQKKWSVTPNPFGEVVYLKTNLENITTISCKVFNVLGVRLQDTVKEVTDGKAQIDLKHLPSATYMLQISSNGKKENHKIIKL